MVSSPYLLPLLGMDLDHGLGVDRGLNLCAEIGYNVLKAHTDAFVIRNPRSNEKLNVRGVLYVANGKRRRRRGVRMFSSA